MKWEDYLAPADLEEDLRIIADDLDPARQNSIQKSAEKIYGAAAVEVPGVPLILFQRPPGTGKTYGMKMLAAHSGLEPWVLDVKGLLEESYKAESLFGRILEKVLTLSNAIVFIDEFESLFTRRSVLAEYGSVMAQSHKKLIANFIRWSEGLETTSVSFSTVYAKVDSF